LAFRHCVSLYLPNRENGNAPIGGTVQIDVQDKSWTPDEIDGVLMNDRTYKDTILVVDDDAINLGVLSHFLREKGFIVLLAPDGEESLHVTEQTHPDLILLDVMMPGGLSGFEVCQRLKSEKNTRDIPIIFLTALTETVDKIKGFELGAADYITKPFQYEELLARVNAHLRIRKLQQELTQQNQLLKDEISRNQKLEAARQKTHHLLTKHTLKLQEHTSELENRQREFDAFADTIAYDLKDSLNAIVSLNAQLEKSCSHLMSRLDVQSKGTLQQIKNMRQQTTNIVDGLLVLAGVFREEDVKLELLNMFDIVTFVIKERLAHKIEQYQAQITLNEVWPTVPGYKPWLEEIWMNYISNGLKYGGKPPRLELGAAPLPHDMVRFWVRDNGQGLTKIKPDELFAASRLYPLRAKGEGLGLPMVQKLVEKMGGQVGVEQTKGKGSLFYFTLPTYK
jgi:two-component system, sensor histidine kinase and response regulator